MAIMLAKNGPGLGVLSNGQMKFKFFSGLLALFWSPLKIHKRYNASQLVANGTGTEHVVHCPFTCYK